MALASDLMGLGMSPHLARREASGGSPTTLQVAAAGTTNLNCTQLGGTQFVASVNSGTGGVCLPVAGGDNGCLLADSFFVNNATGSSITLFLPTGVSISQTASNILGSVGITITTHKSVVATCITPTQWIGVISG